MGNLFTSVLNATNALNVYTQALNVVTNDVTNANTPGYVRQSPTLIAEPFDVVVGLPGGLQFGGVQSARNAYAEQNVRTQQSSLGYDTQRTNDLNGLSTSFDVTGKSGIGPAIDGLFQSFSQLSINPNDGTTRQSVLNSAGQLATTFQDTAKALSNASTNVANETRSAITQINTIASTIAHLNASNPRDYKGDVDPGVDAQLNANLEELSKYVNYSAIQQPDGTVTLYIGGQTPLVQGDQVSALQGDFSTQQTKILNGAGVDITSQIKEGQLGGLIQVQNQDIPSYQSDLDKLATNIADQVNGTLNNGIDQNGLVPANNLLTYDPTAPSQTLALNPAITTDQIAAALPGAPGGNGNAIQLSQLGASKTLNGFTFSAFYGSLAGRIGQDISDSQNSSDAQTQVLSQAQTFRQQVSGVSLDQEAESLVEFQRSYQAASKLISVLNDLTSTVLGIIPSA